MTDIDLLATRGQLMARIAELEAANDSLAFRLEDAVAKADRLVRAVQSSLETERETSNKAVDEQDKRIEELEALKNEYWVRANGLQAELDKSRAFGAAQVEEVVTLKARLADVLKQLEAERQDHEHAVERGSLAVQFACDLYVQAHANVNDCRLDYATLQVDKVELDKLGKALGLNPIDWHPVPCKHDGTKWAKP